MFAHPSPYRREEVWRRHLTDRLFFAIFPDAGVAARIARLGQALRAQHGLRGKTLAAERLHVSLHHVGDYAGLPQHIVAAACRVASAIAVRPFTVEFNGAASFRGRPGHQPFVLLGDDGLVGLQALQQGLSTALDAAGLGHANLHYTPHVTLVYGDHLVADHPVEPITWGVREFVLVHSLLGRSRHIPLARFRLNARREGSAAPIPSTWKS